mmetsp:Transcript_20055/g.69619  ORF Transcript_20055/g.69619 Transcript_20055/m.69619 type:complete len:213 (+) Transcript_20055:9-647(+)
MSRLRVAGCLSSKLPREALASCARGLDLAEPLAPRLPMRPLPPVRLPRLSRLSGAAAAAALAWTARSPRLCGTSLRFGRSLQVSPRCRASLEAAAAGWAAAAIARQLWRRPFGWGGLPRPTTTMLSCRWTSWQTRPCAGSAPLSPRGRRRWTEPVVLHSVARGCLAASWAPPGCRRAHARGRRRRLFRGRMPRESRRRSPWHELQRATPRPA